MKSKKIYFALLTMIIFLTNTFLVISSRTVTLDNKVHDFIINFSSGLMDKVMNVFTFFGSTLWIIVLVAILCVILFVTKRRVKAYLTFSVIASSTILNVIVKHIIQRPRPAYMPEGLETSFSYPSGHTMAATAVYGFLIYLICKSNISKSLKILFSILLTLLIMLVMVSRIYLGAHYFSDVFGGMVFSVFIITVITIIIDEKNLLEK